MLKIAILLILLLVAVILIIAAMKPNTFRVQRSIDISAPPEKVFALINLKKAVAAHSAPPTPSKAWVDLAWAT